MNSNLEPASSADSKSDLSATDRRADSSSPISKSNNEEPEIGMEADLPSDGRDEVGEAMIRDLPERSELSGPPATRSPTGADA